MSIYKFINDLVNGNWADAVAIVNSRIIQSPRRHDCKRGRNTIVVEVRRRTKHTPQIRLIPKQNQTLEIGRTP